jgi:hypothetical protein
VVSVDSDMATPVSAAIAACTVLSVTFPSRDPLGRDLDNTGFGLSGIL